VTDTYNIKDRRVLEMRDKEYRNLKRNMHFGR
jgi:hypothetical protein